MSTPEVLVHPNRPKPQQTQQLGTVTMNTFSDQSYEYVCAGNVLEQFWGSNTEVDINGGAVFIPHGYRLILYREDYPIWASYKYDSYSIEDDILNVKYVSDSDNSVVIRTSEIIANEYEANLSYYKLDSKRTFNAINYSGDGTEFSFTLPRTTSEWSNSFANVIANAVEKELKAGDSFIADVKYLDGTENQIAIEPFNKDEKIEFHSNNNTLTVSNGVVVHTKTNVSPGEGEPFILNKISKAPYFTDQLYKNFTNTDIVKSLTKTQSGLLSCTNVQFTHSSDNFNIKLTMDDSISAISLVSYLNQVVETGKGLFIDFNSHQDNSFSIERSSLSIWPTSATDKIAISHQSNVVEIVGGVQTGQEGRFIPTLEIENFLISDQPLSADNKIPSHFKRIIPNPRYPEIKFPKYNAERKFISFALPTNEQAEEIADGANQELKEGESFIIIYPNKDMITINPDEPNKKVKLTTNENVLTITGDDVVIIGEDASIPTSFKSFSNFQKANFFNVPNQQPLSTPIVQEAIEASFKPITTTNDINTSSRSTFDVMVTNYGDFSMSRNNIVLNETYDHINDKNVLKHSLQMILPSQEVNAKTFKWLKTNTPFETINCYYDQNIKKIDYPQFEINRILNIKEDTIDIISMDPKKGEMRSDSEYVYVTHPYKNSHIEEKYKIDSNRIYRTYNIPSDVDSEYRTQINVYEDDDNFDLITCYKDGTLTYFSDVDGIYVEKLKNNVNIIHLYNGLKVITSDSDNLDYISKVTDTHGNAFTYYSNKLLMEYANGINVQKYNTGLNINTKNDTYSFIVPIPQLIEDSDTNAGYLPSTAIVKNK